MKTKTITVQFEVDEKLSETTFLKSLKVLRDSEHFGTRIATSKQVVSGYHRPVCIKCHCELRPERNGVGILDMAEFGPYKLFDADLWKCPKCGLEVVGGFGYGPIAQHWEENFSAVVKTYKDKGLLVENEG